jgi:hypothetical protein
LMNHPCMPVVLPDRIWTPSLHKSYPESFKKSAKALMMCSYAPIVQAVVPARQEINAAPMLPRALWLEVLSFAHHDWFEPPYCNEEMLQRRLTAAQSSIDRAREAQAEAEARLQLAERERDVYRLLAMRWQARLQAVLTGEQNTADIDFESEENLVDMDDVAEAASALFADEPHMLRFGSLSSVIRRFQRSRERRAFIDRAAENASDDSDGDISFETQMDEDDDSAENGQDEPQEVQPMQISQPEGSDATLGRAQPRTVSIGQEL